MIVLTRKKLKIFSFVTTTAWIIIFSATKSFIWMVVSVALFIPIISVARYLYYKQLTNKTEKRNFLAGELTGLALVIVMIVLALIYFSGK